MKDDHKIYISVENPFVLHKVDNCWIVSNGEVNVFCTQIDEKGEYLSPLKFLYAAKKGEVLFSLVSKDSDHNARLILYSNQATLLPIPNKNLLEMDHFFLKRMIEKWIHNTSIAFNDVNLPRIYKTLEHLGKIDVAQNTIAYPNKGVVWCKLETGKLEVYESQVEVRADDKPKFPIAVSSHLWFKAISNSKLQIIGTNTLLEDEIDFMLAIRHLQDHFYFTLNHILEENNRKASENLKQKIIGEEKVLKSTFIKLKSIVSGEKLKGHDSISNQNDSDLLIACKLIGKEIGVEINAPKHFDSYQKSTTNQLYAIAQNSNVRVRKIILRDTWWKEENGHLLAFKKREKIPVALIQKSSRNYEMVDATNGVFTKINFKEADQLEPIGYMFLPGFDTSMDSIKNILQFATRGIKKDGKLLFLAALLGSLIGLLVPILSGVMFDDVIPTADRSLLWEVFLIMVMIGVVTAGLQLVQGALQLRVEAKSSVNLQAGVMDHLLRLPVTFYNKYSAGDLTNRALSINAIRQIVSSTVMTTVLSGAFTFVNLVLLFYYDAKLALVGLGLAIFAVLFMLVIGWIKLKFDRQISDCQGNLQGFLFEFLSGISKIRITGAEKRIFTLWANKFSKLKQLGFKSGNYQNFVETFNSSYPLLTNIFFFAFIYYTILHADEMTKMLTVGAFMAFITAFNQFLRDCLKMSFALITSLNVISLYERVKPIFEQKTETSEQNADPGELSGEIEMNSVSFRYDEDQPLVLNDISFKIEPGEMVAFVGPSGSGKSTVMRLLLGFEQPEKGSIYYDGDAFDTMNKDLVRRQIGVVLQNGALMSGSIFKNIIGNSDLTLEDAWEAAKMAGMEEDIKQMPMEMHTVISEGAGTFSGGQRQRLMIARAIVHRPRLLFMDEATSALDNKTQHIVSKSLDKMHSTRIVIAHRLSTVKNADRIFVMDKGHIVESGTFLQLMDRKGLFSELAQRQMA